MSKARTANSESGGRLWNPWTIGVATSIIATAVVLAVGWIFAISPRLAIIETEQKNASESLKSLASKESSDRLAKQQDKILDTLETLRDKTGERIGGLDVRLVKIETRLDTVFTTVDTIRTQQDSVRTAVREAARPVEIITQQGVLKPANRVVAERPVQYEWTLQRPIDPAALREMEIHATKEIPGGIALSAELTPDGKRCVMTLYPGASPVPEEIPALLTIKISK